MNNKNLVFFLIFILLSCKVNKGTLNLSIDKTNHKVVILFNKKYKKVALIEFPIKIVLKNNSILKKNYSGIEYKYHPFDKGIFNPLYIEEKGKLIRVKQGRKKQIMLYEQKEYIIYTRHRLDTSQVIQKNFKPYIEEMIANNQDTLTIGTVEEFKNKHYELLKTITNNDSISVQFLDGEELGVLRTIPVKW